MTTATALALLREALRDLIAVVNEITEALDEERFQRSQRP